MIMVTSSITWAQDDSGPTFGLSIDNGISILTNATQVAQEYLFIPETGSPNPETQRPLSPWYNNSLTFDTYLLNGRLSVSVGVKLFHLRVERDTVLPTFFDYPYFGWQEFRISYGMPTVRFCYYQTINDRFAINYPLSISAFEIIDRFYRFGVPYDPDGQSTWDYHNSGYKKFDYGFDFEAESISFEVGALAQYSVGQFDFRAGPTFYFFRNPPIMGHFGLYLKAGVSLRFNKREFN